MITLALYLNADFCLAGPARKVRIIHLDESSIVPIRISSNGSILNFPVKPSKVILGKQGSFSVELIENDIAIAPAEDRPTSNLFVYVLGKRYALSLSAGGGTSDEIIQIRDKTESLMKADLP
jgi:hypothetical protein